MDWLFVKSLTRFCVALARTSLKSATADRAAFGLELTFMALNNFVFFVFWWALFLKVPNIRGQALADVADLFGVVSIGYGLHVVFAGGARELSRMIMDGEIDTYLTQPKPTLLAVLGSRSQASGVGDALSGAILIALFGHLSLSRVPFVVLAGLASAAVLTASVTMVSALAFWLGRVDALERQLFETLLSFSLYPERIFGVGLKFVLYTLVPAGFIGHMPARLISAPSLGAVAWTSAAAFGYLMLAGWLFRTGLRRYASSNHFGIHG
ncbi:MAG TPA: ABC-2 family transporter protein [Polyangiaceae bacterium]